MEVSDVVFAVERDCYFSPECSESGVCVCVCVCVCGGKKEMGKYLEGESATILLGNIPQLFAISFKPVLQ